MVVYILGETLVGVGCGAKQVIHPKLVEGFHS